MKYRTKKVRIRQKSSVLAGLLVLIVGTSLVSAHALTESARLQEALKASLEQPAPSPIPVSTIASKPKLWVAGDSVILGIRNTLAQNSPIGLINARVGRQAAELIKVLRHDKSAMQDSPLILDLGNNNRLTRDEVSTVFEVVKDQPQIIVVNTAVPRSWRDPNNALIAEFAIQYPNATVVDWNAISAGHPEYFGPDGVHLVPAGINAYVDAIMNVLLPIK